MTQDERVCIQRTFHRRLQQSRNTWKQALALEKALEISSGSSHHHHHHHALTPTTAANTNNGGFTSSSNNKKACQLAELTHYK